MTLIEKYIEIHDLRELYTLNRWLSDIPQDEILGHPLICFMYMLKSFCIRGIGLHLPLLTR